MIPVLRSGEEYEPKTRLAIFNAIKEATRAAEARERERLKPALDAGLKAARSLQGIADPDDYPDLPNAIAMIEKVLPIDHAALQRELDGTVNDRASTDDLLVCHANREFVAQCLDIAQQQFIADASTVSGMLGGARLSEQFQGHAERAQRLAEKIRNGDTII